MNEALAYAPSHHVGGPEDAREAEKDKAAAVTETTCQKFDRLARLPGVAVSEFVRSELARLVELRTRFPLPPPVAGHRGQRSGVAGAHRAGLFLRGGRSIFRRSTSYSVAHWAFRTVEAATRTLAAGTNRQWKILGNTAGHF